MIKKIKENIQVHFIILKPRKWSPVNTTLYVKDLLILTTHWPLPLQGCARPPAHSAQSIPYVPFGQHTATNGIFCSKSVLHRRSDDNDHTNQKYHLIFILSKR